MKTLKKMAFICVLVNTSIYAQSVNQTAVQPKGDSLGLAGDNLDLASVLNIFKQSKNVESFEKNLNAADNKVNNLDLNHDGQVDYIRAVESGNDSIHTIVLQVPVSQSESQDVAVIQVEKVNNATAHIQIVGDESLYGKNYVIEPKSDTPSDQNPNYQSSQKEATANQINENTQTAVNPANNNQIVNPPSNSNITINNNNYGSPNNTNGYASQNYYNNYPSSFVNAWGWGAVSYMFAPSYSYWNSPYYWNYYPNYWSPWSPFSSFSYHQRMMGFGYYNFYYRGNHNHMGMAYGAYYKSGRIFSPYVQKTIGGSSGSFYGHRVNTGFNYSTHQRVGIPNNQGAGMQNNGGWNNHHMTSFGGGWHGGGNEGGGHMGGGGGHMGGGGRHR